MADEQTQVTQGNDVTARTETGEIKDQQATKTETTQQDTKQETKTDSQTTKEGETKTETKTEPAKVPDKYDFKAPEGFEIDTKYIEEATPLLKELGLNNEQAQKLFDLQVKREQALAEGPMKAYEEMKTAHRNEVIKSDLGNGTDNLKPEVRANIAKAIQSIGDEKAISAFKEAMDLTGAGDHPAFVRAMNQFGKLLSEGSPVRGAGPSPGGQAKPGSDRPSPAAAMYPNLPSSSQA